LHQKQNKNATKRRVRFQKWFDATNIGDHNKGWVRWVGEIPETFKQNVNKSEPRTCIARYKNNL